MNCKRCGKNVPIHSKHCPNCGLANSGYVPRPEEPASQPYRQARPSYQQPAEQPYRQAQPQYQQPAPQPQPQAQPQPPADKKSGILRGVLLVAAVIVVIFLVKNCGALQLRGTWVASDGSSITFSDNETGYISVSSSMSSARTLGFTYYVEGDEVELKTENSMHSYSKVVRYRFKISGGKLELTDLDNGMVETFSKR